MDVVAAGDVSEGFAPVAAAKRRAALVRGELEGAAQALPARLGPLPAFAGVGTDQFVGAKPNTQPAPPDRQLSGD